MERAYVEVESLAPVHLEPVLLALEQADPTAYNHVNRNRRKWWFDCQGRWLHVVATQHASGWSLVVREGREKVVGLDSEVSASSVIQSLIAGDGRDLVALAAGSLIREAGERATAGTL